jgi:hypothetical protein
MFSSWAGSRCFVEVKSDLSPGLSQIATGDQPIATVVARPDQDQDALTGYLIA